MCRGEVARAFAVVRPPGHHAECARAMGFCFYNNVAVAALAARAEPDVARVLVLDWDVHHGAPRCWQLPGHVHTPVKLGCSTQYSP